MKKVIYIAFFTGIALIGLQSLTLPDTMKKDGAEPGYTGSPGDSFKNCTACHGGVPVQVDGWLTSNIPAEGYEPGQTYTIRAINKEVGATRFGFEVSPQNEAGALLGSMIITDSIRTKFVGGVKYITYTANGVEGQDSLDWSFDWIAPAKGTGAVTFYAGFNSNYEGHKDEDKTYLNELTVVEKATTSITNVVKNRYAISVYPNPTTDQLNIDFVLEKNAKVRIDLFDLSGKLAVHLYEQDLTTGRQQLNLSISNNLSRGAYLVKVQINGNSYTKKIII